MNRSEYINKLKTYLHGLPEIEVADILTDYQEHFDVGISKGKTEEEIAGELGDPKLIANGYRTNFKSVNEVRPKGNYSSGETNMVMAIILIILNAIFVIPVVGGTAFGILTGIFGAGIGIAVGGMGVLLFGGFAFYHILTILGLGLGLISLGILLIILGVYTVKWFYKLAVRYFRWNVELTHR